MNGSARDFLWTLHSRIFLLKKRASTYVCIHLTFQFFNSTENVIIVEVSNVRNVTLRRRKIQFYLVYFTRKMSSTHKNLMQLSIIRNTNILLLKTLKIQFCARKIRPVLKFRCSLLHGRLQCVFTKFLIFFSVLRQIWISMEIHHHPKKCQICQAQPLSLW